MGNLDRGVGQLVQLWEHPDFDKRIDDGQQHERSPLHDELRRAVIARDRFMCGTCHYTPVTDPPGTMMLQVDHLVPVAAGGSDASTNLRTLCERCNEVKSNRFTADVRAVRPRQIMAYCFADVDEGGCDSPTLRLFCAFCRTLRSVDADHAHRYELSSYLDREPAFTDMYTQRRFGLGRRPQLTLDMELDDQNYYRNLWVAKRRGSYSSD